MKKRDKRIPPCPDPERYILVATRESSFWRLKRGLGKPVSLNEGMQQSAELMKVSSPAAKMIADAVRPWLQGMDTGRMVVNIGGRLRKELMEQGFIDYRLLVGYDFQPRHPLGKLLRTNYKSYVEGGYVKLEVPVADWGTVAKKNNLVDGFYFTALLVYGDAAAEEPEVDVIEKTSKIYAIAGEEAMWEEQIELPTEGVPWILILKVSCLAEGEEPHVPGWQGMEVVRAGK